MTANEKAIVETLQALAKTVGVLVESHESQHGAADGATLSPQGKMPLSRQLKARLADSWQHLQRSSNSLDALK